MALRMLAALAVLAALVVSGCAVTNTPMQATEAVRNEVLSYSNPIADRMLTAINSGDYAAFSADFSQDVRNTINIDEFGSLASSLRASIGRYVSRDSGADVMEVGEYYRVTYTTQFTDDSPVSFVLSFKKGGSHLVEGVLFTSKKLSGQITN